MSSVTWALGSYHTWCRIDALQEEREDREEVDLEHLVEDIIIFVTEEMKKFMITILT